MSRRVRKAEARDSELWKALRLILSSRSATVGLLLVTLLLLTAIFAPWIAPYDPIEVRLHARAEPPSWNHLLGTDNFGRDILSRIIHGSRVSLLLGFGSVFIGSVVGIALGLLSGYIGGWLDTILMRMVDILIAFGLILLAILIMAILGPGLINTMIAIGVFLCVVFARLTRGEVLAAREREYVEAARAVGAGTPRILWRYILPNILSPLVVLGTLRLGEAILAEAALSFLGLGPSPPAPSWGLMVAEGLGILRQAPWISLLPGFAIMVTVLGFKLLGDGLRDALDPRMRGR